MLMTVSLLLFVLSGDILYIRSMHIFLRMKDTDYVLVYTVQVSENKIADTTVLFDLFDCAMVDAQRIFSWTIVCRLHFPLAVIACR